MNVAQIKAAVEEKYRIARALLESRYAEAMKAVDTLAPILEGKDAPSAESLGETKAATPPVAETSGSGTARSSNGRIVRRVMVGDEPMSVEAAAERLGVTIGSLRAACAPSNKRHTCGGVRVRWEGEPAPAATLVAEAIPSAKGAPVADAPSPDAPVSNGEASGRMDYEARPRSASGPINPMRLPASEEPVGFRRAGATG